MKTVFPSKKGLEIIIPLGLIISFTAYLLYKEEKIGGLIILLFAIGFIIYLFISTYYIIEDDVLYIKSLLIYECIDIKSIIRVSETNIPLSSPATSLDRLEIAYKKGEFSGLIIISPKDKKGFIDLLLKQNPNIEVHYKAH